MIELLVVIAIIGILASLLLPSLARAKSKAHDTRCVSNLKQLGVAVVVFSDENDGKLPSAEQLPTFPADPASPLPRICDLLAPQLGYDTNAMPQQHTVFRCPRDGAGRFFQNGSSYEWNAAYNGRPAHNMRRSSNPVSEAVLMNDYDNVHGGNTNGTKYVLFGDYHVGRL